jgi:hypothetical protein
MQVQRRSLTPLCPFRELVSCADVAGPQPLDRVVEDDEKAAYAEYDGHAEHANAVVSRTQDSLAFAEI